MVLLSDILDTDLLAQHVENRRVRCQYHPTESLYILNYTASCAYERAWDDVTRQCRGLIVHADTSEIVARPFAKFFNYGEHDAATLDLTAPVRVFDKMDGSLGILYPTADGWAIASTGEP